MSTKIYNYFSKYEPSSMTPNIKILWKKAKGINIWDHKNRKYIDFTSSIFVTNIGHGNKNLNNEIKKTLKAPLTHTYIYYNNPRREYIKKLINFINNKKLNCCFLVSAGTESLEAAIKLMRLNGLKKNKEKKGIISLKGNWHGRTMAAQMLSDDKDQSLWINKDKNFYHIDFPYPWSKDYDRKNFLKKSIEKRFGKKFNYKKKIAGFVIEAFQGWGALFYPKNFIIELKKFCKKNNILLTIDEMQSGFYRTGKKFAYEYYGFTPDLVCIGKAMGSGLPLSGVVTSKKIISVEHAKLQSTHSANPLSCTAGIVTINELKKLNKNNKLKKKCEAFEERLENLRIKHNKVIDFISGKGLIGAIIFKKNGKLSSKEVADKVSFNCLKKGLLVVNTGRESIKLGPPLIITVSQIKTSFKIIDEAIKKL